MSQPAALLGVRFGHLSIDNSGKSSVKFDELFSYGQTFCAEGREDCIMIVLCIWRKPVDGVNYFPRQITEVHNHSYLDLLSGCVYGRLMGISYKSIYGVQGCRSLPSPTMNTRSTPAASVKVNFGLIRWSI